MRREVEHLADLAKALDGDELAFLIGDLMAVVSIAQSRMAAPAAASDDMLDAKTAAGRLGIKVSTFYHRQKKYSFVSKEGSKLVADPKGLERYLAAKRRR